MSQQSWIDALRQWLGRLGLGEPEHTTPQVSTVTAEQPQAVHKRVSLIIHNPSVPSAGGSKLNAHLGWGDPDRLAAAYIQDLREISHGYVEYEIVERIEVDAFPVKKDGFAYKADDFVQRWQMRRSFHQPDAVDYDRLLAEFDMLAKVDAGSVDEFWLFAFPYAGYYESIMGGPGAFWCNAPPLTQTADAKRRFVIMGFNYERGVGEMLEAFGHRAESIMKYVFRNQKGDKNLWERFSRYDKTHPGKAEVGLMHFAPNSVRDYEWGSQVKVKTRCHTWQNFPDLSGDAEILDCRAWGNGDIRAHHKWWFSLLPHTGGSADGIAYNWWQYIVDPDLVQ